MYYIEVYSGNGQELFSCRYHSPERCIKVYKAYKKAFLDESCWDFSCTLDTNIPYETFASCNILSSEKES